MNTIKQKPINFVGDNARELASYLLSNCDKENIVGEIADLIRAIKYPGTDRCLPPQEIGKFIDVMRFDLAAHKRRRHDHRVESANLERLFGLVGKIQRVLSDPIPQAMA